MSYTVLSLLLAGGIAKVVYDTNPTYFKKKGEIRKFKAKWETVMKWNKNKFEQDYVYDYEVLKAIPKSYGMDAVISIPANKDFSGLESMVQKLEIAYGADIIVNLAENKTTAYLRCHYKDYPITEEERVIFKWYKLWYSIIQVSKKKNDVVITEPFEIKKLTKKDYGYLLILDMPGSKTIGSLDYAKAQIEADFRAKIEYEWFRYKGEIVMHIITKEMDLQDRYKPVDLGWDNAFLGYTHYRELKKVCLDTHTNILVSGVPGMGKSVLIQLIVTNFMATTDKVKFMFLLAANTPDFEVFKHCKETLFYNYRNTEIERLREAYKGLQWMYNELERRNTLFNSSGAKNIVTYNKKFKDTPLDRLIVCVDEWPRFMPPTQSDGSVKTATEKTPEKDKLKIKCFEIFDALIKEGRKAGICLIVGIQRPDRFDMPPNFKMAFNVRIAFHQTNDYSSKVVCDNGDATELETREGLLMYSNIRVKIKTPYCDDDLIKESLKNKIDKNHKYIILHEEVKKESPPTADIPELKTEKPSLPVISHKEKQYNRRSRYLENKDIPFSKKDEEMLKEVRQRKRGVS